MSASVIYDGVGGGGTLFASKSFFIAQRVPMRARWVDVVKANGGNIVPLESQADILIADHARKDAPLGSYSWTFIEQSIQNGVLEDLENHRAGPAVGTLRVVGSSLPMKKHRTPFTLEDDRILFKWVTEAEKKGAAVKGNALYEELERKYPHHTLQSWRDHWIKVLQNRPRSDFMEDNLQDPEAAEAPLPHLTSEENILKTQSTPITEDDKQTHRVAEATPVPSADKGNARQARPIPFTEDDFDLLLKIYNDIMNIDVASEIDAWTAWAEEYPQHTAEEWHDFWTNVVKSSKRPAPGNETPSRSARIAGEDRDSNPGSIVLKTTPQPDGMNSKGISSSPEVRSSAEPRFQKYLITYWANHGFKVQCNPVVNGRRVSLFELWLAVRRPELGGFAKVDASGRWPQIAALLGFHQKSDPKAAGELRAVFDESLLDFGVAFVQWQKAMKQSIDAGMLPGEATYSEEALLDYELFKRIEPPLTEKEEEEEEMPSNGFMIPPLQLDPFSPDETAINDQRLNDYADEWVALGYPREIVIEALFCTTLKTGDVGIVMEALRQGLPVPGNMQGVWTREDDEVVRAGGNAKPDELQKVLDKHGQQRLLERGEWLSMIDEGIAKKSTVNY